MSLAVHPRIFTRHLRGRAYTAKNEEVCIASNGRGSLCPSHASNRLSLKRLIYPVLVVGVVVLVVGVVVLGVVADLEVLLGILMAMMDLLGLLMLSLMFLGRIMLPVNIPALLARFLMSIMTPLGRPVMLV